MRKRSSNSAKRSLQPSDSEAKVNDIQRRKGEVELESRMQDGNRDFDQLRSVLAVQLHDLQNALWPAAVEVEVSLSDGNCAPNILEMLKRIECSLEETMTVASQMAALLDRSTVESATSSSIHVKK